MTNPYLPHTRADIERMLEVVGVESLEALYADVPRELLLGREYALPEGLSEKEVRDYFDALGRENSTLVPLAGGGFYAHYAPALIDNLLQRSEFLTSYTPYQPEVSQGTLHYIFEFQSMICALTGMEVSNASMYDGSTATAEAMLMAMASVRKAVRCAISATVDPAVQAVVATYARHHGVELVTIPEREGVTDLDALAGILAGGGVAGVILPQPNRYGIVEDYTGVADKIHGAKALMIMHCVASTLGVLRTPGDWGADIACGDAQSLGMPLSYGGPYLGFLACSKGLMRKLPGRIVGATKDAEGRRCFVLTLQAREQHIRREKATSNICSNQGLMALYCTVYLSLMGPEGLREVNEISADGAHYLAARLQEEGLATLTWPGRPWLNEMLLTVAFDIDAMQAKAAEKGYLAGVKVDDTHLLMAVTEMVTREQIDDFITFLKDFCHE